MKIIDGSYPPVPTSYSVNLREVVNQLLQKDAAARPSALQLLASPPLIQAASELEIALPQPAMELFQAQLTQAALADQGKVAAARQSQTMSRLAQPKRNSASSPEPSTPVVSTSAATAAVSASASAAQVASVSNLHLALHRPGQHGDGDSAGGPSVVDPLTGAAQASPLRGRKARPRNTAATTAAGSSKAAARAAVSASPIKPQHTNGTQPAAPRSALAPRGGRVRVRGRGAAGTTVGRADSAASRTRHRPLPPAAQHAAQKAAAAHGSAYRRRTHASTRGRSATARGGSRAPAANARSQTSNGRRSPAAASPEGKTAETPSSTTTQPHHRAGTRSGEALRSAGRQSSTSAGRRRVTVQDVLQVSAAGSGSAAQQDKQGGVKHDGASCESALSPRTSPVQMLGAFGDLAIAGSGLGGHSIDPSAAALRSTPSRSSKHRTDGVGAQGQRPLAPVPRRPATASGDKPPPSNVEGGQRLRNHNYPSDTPSVPHADGNDPGGDALEPTGTSMPLSARGLGATHAEGGEGKSEGTLPPIRATSRGGAVTPGPQLLRRDGGGSRSARSSFTGGTTGGIGAATAGPMPAVLPRADRQQRPAGSSAAWQPTAGQALDRPSRDSSPQGASAGGGPTARPRQAWSDWGAAAQGMQPGVGGGLRALDSTATTAVHSTIQEVTEPLTDDTPPQSGRGGVHSPLEHSVESERSFLHGAHDGHMRSNESTWDSFDDSFLRHQAIAEASVGDSKTDEGGWAPEGGGGHLPDAKHMPMTAVRERTPAEVEEDIAWGSGESSSAEHSALGATGGSAASHFLAATGASSSGTRAYLPQLKLPVMQAPAPSAVQSARAKDPALGGGQNGGAGGAWSLEQHGYGRPLLRRAHSQPSSPRDIRTNSPPMSSSRLHVNPTAASRSGLLGPVPGTARVQVDDDDAGNASDIGYDSQESDTSYDDSDGASDGKHSDGSAAPQVRSRDALVPRSRDSAAAGATNAPGGGVQAGEVHRSTARPRQLDVPEHFLSVQPARVESAPLSPLSDDEDALDGGLPQSVPGLLVAQSAESDADAAHLSATAGAAEAKSVGMAHPAVQRALEQDALLAAASGRQEELQCAASELQYKLRLASVDAEDALDEGGVAAEEAQLRLEELQGLAARAKRRAAALEKWSQERCELHLRLQQLAAACRHIKTPTPSAAAMLDNLLNPKDRSAYGSDLGRSTSGPSSPAAGSADDVDALLSQLTGEQQMLLFKLQFFHGKLKDSSAVYQGRFAGAEASP